MSSYSASIRYAKSILDLAKEKNIVEEVKEDMLLFTKTIRENHALGAVLKNPTIPVDKKKMILKLLFQKKIQPLTHKAFELCLNKNRENIIEHIALKFIVLYNTLKGIVLATITTPFTLDDSQRKEACRVVEAITKMKVVLLEEVDKSLIGGFILKIEDKQIDESIKNKLNQIKRALVA